MSGYLISDEILLGRFKVIRILTYIYIILRMNSSDQNFYLFCSGKNPTLRPNGCYPAHHSKDTMFPLTDEGYYSADMESHYVETWEAMEKLVDEGLTKTIGLSNFNR